MSLLDVVRVWPEANAPLFQECFKNRILARDDIGTGQVDRDVRLDVNINEFASISKTVVLGTHASGTAPGV